jgi:glycosyltransferase involved in cell wall biosynthesis
MHVLLTSNRWYSAASEYGLRLFEHLHRSAKDNVAILSHGGSPILSRAQAIGIGAQVFAIRGDGGVALGPFGLLRAFWAVRNAMDSLDRAHPEGAVFWVLEGTEHALACAVRLFYPRLRNGPRLVRLRVQDRFPSGGPLPGFFERHQARLTDLVVFPSEHARFRYFSAKTKIEKAYAGRVFVQPFCKDPLVAERGHFAPQDTVVFEWLRQQPLAVTFVSVARFDPIKGLIGLIDSFCNAGADRPLQLVICGRTEALKAKDLWLHALEKLGSSEGERRDNCYFAASKSGGHRVAIIDGHFGSLANLLAVSQCAIVSSLGSEIICRTAVECLQAGLPVISTTAGSLPEVIGDCGWLVPLHPGAAANPSLAPVEGLTAAIQASIKVLGTPRDSALSLAWRQRCLSRGREFVLDGFSPLVAKARAPAEKDVKVQLR